MKKKILTITALILAAFLSGCGDTGTVPVEEAPLSGDGTVHLTGEARRTKNCSVGLSKHLRKNTGARRTSRSLMNLRARAASPTC